MQRPRESGWIALALIVAVIIRLCAIHFHFHVLGDALTYGDLARNIVQHHQFGFSEDGGIRSTLIRLPGYPLFLAACFSLFGVQNYTAVLYVQLIIDVTTCILLAALAYRLMGRKAGIITLWLAALCPFTADYVAAPYTETAAIFCAALAFYSLERWHATRKASLSPWLWPLALSLAFCCLLRPDRALLAVAVIGAMTWLAWHSARRLHRFLQVAIVCLIIALPLSIWTLRNWRVFHVIQPLAPRYANDPGEVVNYGFQRWYRTWGVEYKSTYDIYWTFDGSLMDINNLPSRAFDSAPERAQTEALFAQYNDVSSATPTIDKEFADLAAQRIHAHPFRYYVELPIARLANMWFRPRTDTLDLPIAWWHFREDRRGSLEAAALGLANLAYLTLASIGLWRWKRHGWNVIATSMLAFVLLRCALLLTVDNSEPRYTMDCYPIVILLSAFALARRTHSEQP